MAMNSEIRATPESFAAEIVAAYVSNNQVAPAELPGLIDAVRAALMGLGTQPETAAEPEPPTPAVSIKKSVTPDHIACLECGKSFKSLKRHLLTHHGLSPEDYRQRWSLNAAYPMVAPNYADARSQLALSMGLGRKRSTGPEDMGAEEADDAALAAEPDASEDEAPEDEMVAVDMSEVAEPAEADAPEVPAEEAAPAPKRRGGGRRKAATA